MIVIPDAPLPRGDVAKLFSTPDYTLPESTLRDAIERHGIPTFSASRFPGRGRKITFLHPDAIRKLALALDRQVAGSCESDETDGALLPQVPQEVGDSREESAQEAHNESAFARSEVAAEERDEYRGRAPDVGEPRRRVRFVGVVIRLKPWAQRAGAWLLAALGWTLRTGWRGIEAGCWIVLRFHFGVRAADWLCGLEPQRETVRRMAPATRARRLRGSV